MLSDIERDTLTTTILEHVKGRVPVIVTTTHFSTQICLERSLRAQQVGAAAHVAKDTIDVEAKTKA